MIRDMNEKDLARVCEIWQKGIKETAPPLISGKPWDSRLSAMIENTQEANEKYVYEKDGIIKGFTTAGIPDDKDYISELYVESQFQGQGIGKQLLNKLKENHTELTLDVYEMNANAIAFYKKRDFKVSGEKKCPHTGSPKLDMKWEKI